MARFGVASEPGEAGADHVEGVGVIGPGVPIGVVRLGVVAVEQLGGLGLLLGGRDVVGPGCRAVRIDMEGSWSLRAFSGPVGITTPDRPLSLREAIPRLDNTIVVLSSQLVKTTLNGF